MQKEKLSVEEFGKISGKLAPEDRLLAGFMAATGCKVSEAVCVLVKDLDPEEGAVHVFGQPCQPMCHDRGKEREGPPKTIKLPAEFLAKLQDYIKNTAGLLKNDYIFYPESSHDTPSRETARKRFTEKLGLAGKETIGRSVGTEEIRGILQA